MSKRRYYRNFNKRKKFNGTRIVTVILCLGVLGTYTYINVKNNDFLEKLSNINVVSNIKNAWIWDRVKNLFDKSNVITSSNINTELEEIEKEDKNKDEVEDKEKDSNKEKENSKVTTVKEMVAYTIQVASLENQNELKKIEEVMNEYKIPSSSLSIDNSEKIQVYVSFNQDDVRNNLQKTRNYFSDAFLTKIDVPMLSLQYTSSYSYMKDIAEGLNDLIENFQSESTYWDKNQNDLKAYNKILTNRKEILKKLKTNAEKIDYTKMDKFKNNLISYIDEMENNILIASKSTNENKTYISEGLLLSSIQQYYAFVQSMK